MDPIGVPREVAREAAAAGLPPRAPVPSPAPAPAPYSSAHKRLLKPADRVSMRFRVLRMLNSGGCAEVYEAIDETTGEHVAVKVETHSYSAESLAPAPVVAGPGRQDALDPRNAGDRPSPEPPICPAALASLAASLPEFSALRELGALGPERYSAVRALGIPPVLEMGVVRLSPPGASSALLPLPRRLHPYLAMHLGASDFEEEGEVLSGKELVVTAEGALSALRALHGCGRVHRDVKPSNFVRSRQVENAAHAMALRRCRKALEAAAEKGTNKGEQAPLAAAMAAAAAAAGAVVELPARGNGTSSSPPKAAGETTEDEGDGDDDKAYGKTIKHRKTSNTDDDDGEPTPAAQAAAAASLPPAPWPFADVCPAAATAPLCRPPLYLIDYGFARRLDDEPRDRRGKVLFHGTPDFASVRALQGCAQRSKDDYEALAYVLLQLATGRLPWRLTTNSAAARGWTSDELSSFARRKVAAFKRAVAQGLVPPFVERLVRYLWSLRAEEDADEGRVDAIVKTARSWRGRPRAYSEDDWSEEVPLEDEGEEEEDEEEAVPATTTEEEHEAPQPRPRAARPALALAPPPSSSPLGPRASCPPDVPPTNNASSVGPRPRRRLALSAPCSRLASASGELDAAADRVGAAAAATGEAAAPPTVVDAAEAAALAAELAVAPPIVALHQVREGSAAAVVLEQLGDRELLLQADEEAASTAAVVAEGPPAAVEAGLLALDGAQAAGAAVVPSTGAKRPAPLPPISAEEQQQEQQQEEEQGGGDKENAAPAVAGPAVAAAPPAAKRLRLSDDFGRQRQILMEEADE